MTHLRGDRAKAECANGEDGGNNMTSTKLVTVLLAAGLLAGCANLQTMANAQRAEAAKAEGKQLVSECMARYEDSRLDVIRHKVAFRADEITARHLAIQEVPTAEERDALLVFQTCLCYV